MNESLTKGNLLGVDARVELRGVLKDGGGEMDTRSWSEREALRDEGNRNEYVDLPRRTGENRGQYALVSYEG